MAIYYVDLYNGNDSNDGLSWATAWKTITTGATTARIAPGDEIRISKTPDPVYLCDVSLDSLTKSYFSIPPGLVKTILFGDSTSFVASSGVTASYNTMYKTGGTAAFSFTIPSAVTGKIAYKTLSAELDLSDYQELAVALGSSYATSASAGLFAIALCSDTLGETVVDLITINDYSNRSSYLNNFCFKKDGGGNLGSNINSVALYKVGTYGFTVTLYLDAINACKSGGLNPTCGFSFHQDVISERQPIMAVAYIKDDVVFALASVSASYNTASISIGVGTFPLYVLELFKQTQVSSSTTGFNSVMDSGRAALPIKYKAGINVLTDFQDGLTLFRGGNGYGNGLVFSSITNIEISNFGFFSMNAGIVGINGSCNIRIENIYGAGNTSYVVDVTGGSLVFIQNAINGGSVVGVLNLTGCSMIWAYSLRSDSTLNRHVALSGSSRCNIQLISKKPVNSYFFMIDVTCDEITLFDLDLGGTIYKSNNLNLGVHANVRISNSAYEGGASWTAFGNNSTNILEWQSEIYPEGMSGSWKLQTGGANYYTPTCIKIAEFAVEAGKLVTMTAMLRGLATKIFIPKREYIGIPEDVKSQQINSYTEFIQHTVTFTPSVSTVLEAYILTENSGPVYGVVYVGNISIAQAD